MDETSGTFEVHVLFEGYSKIHPADENGLITASANASCVLITNGKLHVVVDTLTPWDRDLLVERLNAKGVKPEDVQFLVCTHGHSDHIGNNNLFTNAKHIVGYCVSFKDTYYFHPFDQGQAFRITMGLDVIPTPGHTSDDVSVVVNTKDKGVVVIAGDIFEREEDIEDPSIWRSEGGSVDPERQERSRNMILSLADYIVPGHGPMFRVTKSER